VSDGLPPDVHEDSGCRLPLPERDRLPPAAQELFDRHVDPDGGTLAGLRGPGGIKLHSPEYAVHAAGVLHYLRQGTGLPTPIRELAILVTAREHDSRFEWSKHEPEGLRQGLTQETIDAVKHRRPVDRLPGLEATVITFGRQLFRDHRVDPDVFADALDAFGPQRLVDLVALMGTYAATAALLAAFDAQLPEDETYLLPMP
jgi:4-carboxymuconolactone decarboxylase